MSRLARTLSALAWLLSSCMPVHDVTLGADERASADAGPRDDEPAPDAADRVDSAAVLDADAPAEADAGGSGPRDAALDAVNADDARDDAADGGDEGEPDDDDEDLDIP